MTSHPLLGMFISTRIRRLHTLGLPMLYADCEGLQGGEMEPAAKKLLQKNKNTQAPQQSFFRGKPREVLIAKSNNDANKREWAVKRVYPRLLYTFSDVVVFVLRNTRYKCSWFSQAQLTT